MASLALGLGSIVSGIIGGSAANSAANKQVAAANQALGFQQQIYANQQQNQAPYLQAGQQSISQLMQALQSGKFGPGSTGAVPTAPGAFVAPTLQQAQQSPGYQFTQQQGNKGILQGAAALGGNINGNVFKTLDNYNTNLANNTYSTLFGQALQGYNANLSQYASQLAGYQTGLQSQQQQYNQLLQPALLGEGSVQSINNTGSQASQSIGNLMTQIGNAQAAGTVGVANAATGAINGLGQSYLYGQLLNSINNQNATPAGVTNLSQSQYDTLTAGSSPNAATATLSNKPPIYFPQGTS